MVGGDGSEEGVSKCQKQRAKEDIGVDAEEFLNLFHLQNTVGDDLFQVASVAEYEQPGSQHHSRIVGD